LASAARRPSAAEPPALHGEADTADASAAEAATFTIVGPQLAVVVPSIGRARAQETVESIAASARAGDVTIEIALAWQSPDTPPALPDFAHAVEVLPLGVSYAKNRALATLSAPLVGFVDDDELVDPGWAAGVVSAFADNPDVDAVFGAIAPLDDRGLPYCHFEGGEERRFSDASTPPWIVGAGGNMAVRRAALERVGGFDVVFGPGTLALCADDTDLVVRLLRAGKQILWTPDAVVYHPSKTEQERLDSRRPYGWGMGKVVRRHRDLGNGVRYAGYGVQSFLTGVVRRNRRRRREAAATLRGFTAGVSRRTPWIAPRSLLEWMPHSLREEVDVAQAASLPVQYRPNPHLVYFVGEKVVHVYTAPEPELHDALAAREVIRRESTVEGIPAVLAFAEGRDSLWVVEERRDGGGNPDSAGSVQIALDWAATMAQPLGPRLGDVDGWRTLCATIAADSPAALRPAVSAACERLASLPAAHAHGDFQRKNVFVHDGRVSVLDWEWARARDLPGADLVFYAVTASGSGDADTVLTLARGGETLDVPVLPMLAELGVSDERLLRDLLLVQLVRWAAAEGRRGRQWGVRPSRPRYAELLAVCASAIAS
jgi:Glycosyl transferase family group 2